MKSEKAAVPNIVQIHISSSIEIYLKRVASSVSFGKVFRDNRSVVQGLMKVSHDMD